MLLSSALVALSLLTAAVSPVAAGSQSPAGLHRRRCRASHGLGVGGAVNVGNKPTSSPGDEPHAPQESGSTPAPSGCFPSAGFNVPDSPKGIDVDKWWCPRSSEYAFLGFSHAIDDCPSKGALTNAFNQMKNQFKARYVRTYGACDRDNFNSDLIEAAYEAGIGIYYLVWFGFDGGNQWQNRLNGAVSAANNHPLGRYVIRAITIGSEPLFDHAISEGELANQLNKTRARVGGTDVEVSTSEMPYLLRNAGAVLKAADHYELNVLPFFDGRATRGSAAGGTVTSNLDSLPSDKKILMTQTGWPTTDEVWKANSGSAVASADSAQGYYNVLDGLCPKFKQYPGGGIGWFAHTFSDAGLPGWGVTKNGQAKYDFSPRTKC